MQLLLVSYLILALNLIEAKKVITTPKNSVFMSVPPVGWKQKRVLAYNDKVYSEFNKNITKARL